ncbi:hypothetical protein EDD22DRAFT_843997 [Suillus occidentalis]|nr:hypothetical protein EDD22DRAFT_843997 [Suillus occidentalis]
MGGRAIPDRGGRQASIPATSAWPKPLRIMEVSQPSKKYMVTKMPIRQPTQQHLQRADPPVAQVKPTPKLGKKKVEKKVEKKKRKPYYKEVKTEIRGLAYWKKKMAADARLSLPAQRIWGGAAGRKAAEQSGHYIVAVSLGGEELLQISRGLWRIPIISYDMETRESKTRARPARKEVKKSWRAKVQNARNEVGRSFRGHGEKNFAIIFLQHGSNVVSSKARNNNEWALAMLEVHPIFDHGQSYLPASGAAIPTIFHRTASPADEINKKNMYVPSQDLPALLACPERERTDQPES